MGKYCSVKQLLDVARAELGYLEKASNAQLDDKYANAGSGNFTKYARDLNAAGYYNGNKNGFAWCDVFVDWCFYMATGKDKTKAQAQEYQTGELGAGCVYSAGYYKQAKRWVKAPAAGDQIFFLDSDGEEGHTGLVEKVERTTITTIEGNRENCVKRYTYSVNDRSIAGYGRPKYYENGTAETTTQPASATTPSTTGNKIDLLGVDVSGDQDVINWKKVKDAGVNCAFIKFGNVYESEDLYVDSKFAINVQGCVEAGIPYGVYVFTYVSTLDRFKQEIKKAIDRIKAACPEITYPVYLDVEDNKNIAGGNANLLAMVKAFAETVRAAGMTPGVYSATSWWDSYMTDKWYDTIEKWVADWRGKCYYTGTYSIWQYSSNGRIDGIPKNVDLDRVYFAPEPKAAPAGKKILLGDVDQDGKITAADARHVLKQAAGLEPTTEVEI